MTGRTLFEALAAVGLVLAAVALAAAAGAALRVAP